MALWSNKYGSNGLKTIKPISYSTLLRALNTLECRVNAQKLGYFKKQFSNLFDNRRPEYIYGITAEVMGNHWKEFSEDSNIIIYLNFNKITLGTI